MERKKNRLKGEVEERERRERERRRRKERGKVTKKGQKTIINVSVQICIFKIGHTFLKG